MSRIFDEILEKRGIDSSFLNPKYLSDKKIHKKLPDIKVATERILEAISKGEKIMVYGDYDVDGITATTVMIESLKMSGVKNVVTMLPDRFVDGYGMSGRVVDRAKAEEVSLIITVDCGSNNSAVISELKEAGIDTIVTDHHEVMMEVPKDAIAVVNPKRTDITEKMRDKIIETGLIDLAGVGVAFMVSRSLVEAGKIPDGQEKWLLDLVVIGTLCDSMRISKINRELTFYGMKVLEKTRRIGLKELILVARCTKLSSEAVGFLIGPRLNAGGRMESAEISLALLNATSKAEAVKLAEELNNLNTLRKNEQMMAMNEVSEKYSDALTRDVIVVSGKWHEGVLGIVAGRLVEKYHKPAFVLSNMSAKDVDGDGVSDVFKGSGRSFGDFNLAEVIKNCPSVFAGGGHAAACGIKILPDKIEDFIKDVNEYYASLKLKNQEKYLKISAEIFVDDFRQLDEEVLDEIAMLEPFGEGNEEPIFGLLNAEVVEVKAIGKDGKHLRMVVKDEMNTRITLVAFSAPEEWFNVAVSERKNIMIQLMRNEWNGRTFVEGRILDIEA